MALQQLSRTRIRGGTHEQNPVDLVVYQGSDPAAQAQVVESVPEGKVWRIRSVFVRIVMGLTGNIRPGIAFDDGANNLAIGTITGSLGASTTYDIVALLNLPVETASSNLTNARLILLPDLLLGPGFRVKTDGGLNSDDNYDAPIFVVEESPAAPLAS